MEEDEVVTSSYADKVPASRACALDFWESVQEKGHHECATELFGISLDVRESNRKYKFIGIQAPLVLLGSLQKELSKLCSRDRWWYGFSLGVLIMQPSRFTAASNDLSSATAWVIF